MRRAITSIIHWKDTATACWIIWLECFKWGGKTVYKYLYRENVSLGKKKHQIPVDFQSCRLPKCNKGAVTFAEIMLSDGCLNCFGWGREHLNLHCLSNECSGATAVHCFLPLLCLCFVTLRPISSQLFSRLPKHTHRKLETALVCIINLELTMGRRAIQCFWNRTRWYKVCHF